MTLLATVFVVQSSADARTLYVNNRVGQDQFDGLLESATSGESGPVRTIGRALALAQRSDLIVVANTGQPYYETFTMMGRDNSGTESFPFRIVSQGAIVSGAVSVPATGWQKVGADLWRVVPYRKGTYQLIRSGKALTERRQQKGERWFKVPVLAANEWCHFKGAIYYHAEQYSDPSDDDFAIAQGTTGATLLKVEHVVIRGLIFQHFRVDGIQLHDQAQNVLLDNVGTYENGRSGLTVAGTSILLLRECAVERNRDHSVLLQGLGAMEVEDSTWDKPPTNLNAELMP